MNTAPFAHQSVFLQEILDRFPLFFQDELLGTRNTPRPASRASFQNRWMLDATFGAGGHTKAALRRYSSLSVIALDRDLSSVQWGIKNIKPLFPGRSFHLFHSNFHHYPDLMKNRFPLFLKGKGFDIIIVDLGVSSPQLDQAHRGFSFYQDGPLDMRMDVTQTFSATDIINHWSERELMDLFYLYGEIHTARPVVKALLRQRKKASIKSTKELADLIVKKQGWKKKGSHPATPYFLALRLKVNNELEGLSDSLPDMIRSLNPKGRFFVLTFHSLEDRIVKNIFKQAHNTEGINLTKKVITPSLEEIKKNPRAKSAKLRLFERGNICHV